MTDFEFLLRIGAALVLGAAIGLERQWRQRMAGLRTNALVAVGAALFVTLTALVDQDASPTRMAAQVVSGIGFLGAGVIMREGLTIRGLNTAATLWCAAAVGVLSGSGAYLFAGLGAAAILLANILLRPLANVVNRCPTRRAEAARYHIVVVCTCESEQHIRTLLLQILNSSAVKLRSLHSEDQDDPRKVEVRAQVSCESDCDRVLEQAVSRLSLESAVSAIRWELVDGDGPEEEE